jgi:formamidopyrimidine-DNA glycosylase
MLFHIFRAFIITTMVEGPGCKLKGEKMRGKVLGQKVVHVSGNAVDKRPKKAGGDSPLLALVGQQVVDVRTLGKELFILLSGGSCLRVHFLMAGFVRYNDLAGKTALRYTDHCLLTSFF